MPGRFARSLEVFFLYGIWHCSRIFLRCESCWRRHGLPSRPGLGSCPRSRVHPSGLRSPRRHRARRGNGCACSPSYAEHQQLAEASQAVQQARRELGHPSHEGRPVLECSDSVLDAVRGVSCRCGRAEMQLQLLRRRLVACGPRSNVPSAASGCAARAAAGRRRSRPALRRGVPSAAGARLLVRPRAGSRQEVDGASDGPGLPRGDRLASPPPSSSSWGQPPAVIE
mmetsp:Transcript_53933/g.136717  ORF Transcript_53933/g.136717 Transcript_53933/m.136717 type:complete len:226 (-) Transcript_53933:113-790(-)